MVNIRLAVVSDAMELAKLNDIFNGEDCNTLATIEKSLRYNKQETVCVACKEDILVGFCCGQIFLSMCYDVNYGEMTELFVLEEYRRQSVASGLIAFMEAEFRKQGINHFQLFTGRDNQAAQAFYRSIGYSEAPEIMFRKQQGRIEYEHKNDSHRP